MRMICDVGRMCLKRAHEGETLEWTGLEFEFGLGLERVKCVALLHGPF